MKQILIEKYIEPTKTTVEIGMFDEHIIIKRWENEYGELHGLLGHPAFEEYINGSLTNQSWNKKGVYFRKGDKPSETYYFNEKRRLEKWFKNDVLHRDGNKPAWVNYDLHGKKIILTKNFENGRETTLKWTKRLKT